MEAMLVRLEIPIPVWQIVALPAMLFSRWLPLEEKEFIKIQKEDATLKLWFDRSCAPLLNGDEIEHYRNLLVEKIFADVALQNISNELVSYIQTGAYRQAPEDDSLRQQYEDLTYKVYVLALTYINRLISYVRNQKGQYWLGEYTIGENHSNIYVAAFLDFNAKALINSQWVKLYPSGPQNIMVTDRSIEI